MTKLSILADENIPGLEPACADWGNIITMSGRDIKASDLVGIDLLFVRSVTQVNAELLSNTDLKFVGSATIGVDHIDLDYLASRGIGFAHAPGSNANGVVDYVMSVILDHYDNARIEQLTVAIVGYGNVGSRLARCLRHFSIAHVIYDPLFTPSSANKKLLGASPNDFVESIDDLLNCDITSVHVPLTTEGDCPTYHLFDAIRLSQLSQNALFINSSRGPVVNNAALKALLMQRSDLTVALDVWEGEPNIDLELYPLCDTATPHIAGYSLDGKLRGTSAIVSAAMVFFNLTATESPEDKELVALNDLKTLADYRDALSIVYSAKKESVLFEQAITKKTITNTNNIAQIFDAYRKSYPARREINYDG
ncbi:MAG: 4-phosphoerythronate dehydrogenase [Cellvibrionales bacterium]|nr:4-phosphoerythronate dehydrogenase [Cellvibrionales bacterium]